MRGTTASRGAWVAVWLAALAGAACVQRGEEPTPTESPPEHVVELDRPYLSDRDARDGNRRPLPETADLVEGRVQREPSGSGVGQAADLDRKVGDGRQPHGDEQAHQEIASR